jgi:phosphopantetheine--protein transferase-like protein
MPDLSSFELKEKGDRVRSVIATLLRCDPASITDSTVIDRTAIPSSLLIHKMYSLLEKESGAIRSARPTTFGDLMHLLGNAPRDAQSISRPTPPGNEYFGMAIGVDIERIDDFSIVNDYRADPFYRQNFTAAEISHSIMQVDKQQSFAGQFAAKEAIVKADNRFLHVPFNEIGLRYDEMGKPSFPGFSISISHSNGFAVAAAIAMPGSHTAHSGNPQVDLTEAGKPWRVNFWKIVAGISIVLNGIVIILGFTMLK